MTGDAARELYVRRGWLGRVGGGRTPAVLVVDMIYGFTDPAAPTGCALDAEVAATRTLLDAARALGTPVLFTTQSFEPSMRDAGLWVLKIPALHCLQAGTRLVEVDDRLGRRPDEPVIDKKFASAFFGTPLLGRLVAAGVDTVVIAGCTTSGCVRATAVDALGHGLHPLVVREAVGDRAAGPHAANLFDLDAKYADVVGLAEAIDYLRTAAKGRPGRSAG